ncbi:hypothetical protein [Selenomonas ruminantium]|uniref:hypothetical protein n=1 Tax=Selenomonas ruminantium TaxID=971 RepID=UPI001179D986|nr:hypothetical protein [Selenomonas ruminantium]
MVEKKFGVGIYPDSTNPSKDNVFNVSTIISQNTIIVNRKICKCQKINQKLAAIRIVKLAEEYNLNFYPRKANS